MSTSINEIFSENYISIIFLSVSPAFSIEIGVVDLNEALNQSEPGIRSKNILERRGRQKQQEFKLKESELRKLADDLRKIPCWLQKQRGKAAGLITRQQKLRKKPVPLNRK
ncbi:MAG: hypothetical protein Ct9H300mP28_09740 [Pseudomonadota bacterium]|nr:MAG: hypothetical protein Ct9H300mP28_09740 [Pseudomonadota bacterium]